MTLNDLYLYALSFYGIPYQYGGGGPSKKYYGFDCSGLVEALMTKADVQLPHARDTADTLYRHFKAFPQGRGLGYLAFFGTEDRVSHVGFMLNAEIMISAASGGSWCNTVEQAKSHDAYVKIQPVKWYRVPPFLGAYWPNYAFVPSNVLSLVKPPPEPPA